MATKTLEGGPQVRGHNFNVALAYYGRILNFELRNTGNPDLAQDLTQEAVLKLGTRPNLIRVDERTIGYVFRTARSVLVDHLRRQKNRVITLDDPSLVLVAEDNPLAHALSEERRETLHHAIDQLPPLQRQTVTTRFIEEKDTGEVAAAMGCPRVTVSTRTRKALARLSRAPQLAEYRRII